MERPVDSLELEDVLVADDRLVPHLATARALAMHLEPPIALDLEAPGWGGALTRYLLLSHWPGLLLADGIAHRAIACSRYYWFSRFATSHAVQSGGPDAGIEQQRFALGAELIADAVDVHVVDALDARATAHGRESMRQD